MFENGPEDAYKEIPTETMEKYRELLAETDPEICFIMVVSASKDVSSASEVSVGGLSALNPVAALDILTEMSGRFSTMIEETELVVRTVEPLTSYIVQRVTTEMAKTAESIDVVIFGDEKEE